VNKKVMASALRSALSLRAQAGDLVVVKSFAGDAPKTKILAKALEAIKAPRALLVDDANNAWLERTSRNLERSSFLAAGGINVYDILRFPKLVIAESAVRALEERLKKTLPKARAAAAGGAA
jgi:large subunit ribosomal protein L4